MTISQRDQNCIWHPFTQHKNVAEFVTMVSGKGAYLYDEQGKRYLDLISSWWVNLFGHSHPAIAEAIYQQAQILEQVSFLSITHEPAVQLAEELLPLLPQGFSKVFYSDNGSTATEVALKMAYQYWQNQGECQRNRFIAFERGYHGDTFGAMAVGKKSGFFGHFEELLFEVKMFSYPETWINDAGVQQKEQEVLQQITDYLEQYGKEIAALIIEPLIQGAGGMRMCRPEFLLKLEQVVRSYGVLIIYDEVMTGFYRTGEYFACLKAQTTPDIICLAKGLTGGFLPLAITACQEKIYQAFLGGSFKQALAHGHSFTANPLGCAAALASLKLLTAASTKAQIEQIELVHRQELQRYSKILPIRHARFCGTVAAFAVDVSADYGSDFSLTLRKNFFKRGLLISPLGNVVYLLPPYCVTPQELKMTYDSIAEEIQGIIA